MSLFDHPDTSAEESTDDSTGAKETSDVFAGDTDSSDARAVAAENSDVSAGAAGFYDVPVFTIASVFVPSPVCYLFTDPVANPGSVTDPEGTIGRVYVCPIICTRSCSRPSSRSCF